MDRLRLIETTVDGRYLVHRVHCRGGSSVLYRGEDVSTGKPVAMKFLLVSESVRAEARESVRTVFRDQMQIARRLHGPGLMEVLAFGVHGEEATPYVVTEWIDGLVTLEDRLEQGPLSMEEIVSIGDQLVESVSVLHQARFAHGWIRPDRVLLSTGRQLPLVRLHGVGFDRALLSIPPPPVMLTIDPWRAPTSQRNAPPTPLHDAWSLALVVFTMCTGKPFWRSLGAEELVIGSLIREILGEPVPPASVRAAELGGRPIPPSADAAFAMVLTRSAPSVADKDLAREFWAALRPRLLGEPEEPDQREEPLRGNPKGSFYDDGLDDDVAPSPRPEPAKTEPRELGLLRRVRFWQAVALLGWSILITVILLRLLRRS